MKYLAIGLVYLYRICLSPFLHSIAGVKTSCRYTPSCSAYAIQSFKTFGFYTGTILSVKRLLSCQPFGTIQQ